MTRKLEAAAWLVTFAAGAVLVALVIDGVFDILAWLAHGGR